MNLNQLLKLKKKTSYKVVVCRCLLLFSMLLFLVFGGYSVYSYRGERRDKAEREAQNTAKGIVYQNDERLQNLRQYYLAMADNEAVGQLLEHEITYSDYSIYKSAYDAMNASDIFTGYIKSFTFANFKTCWVLNNKGLFPLDEVYNQDMLMEIYERELGLAVKNYWSMDAGIEIENVIDRTYRITVETNGLNFIMKLPVSSYNTHAIFIANINMETWKNWIKAGLAEYEQVVVLTQEGELVYATNDEWVEQCVSMHMEDRNVQSFSSGRAEYSAAGVQSEILGWKYYVIYDIKGGQADIRLPIILVVLLPLVIFAFVLVSRLIYQPVHTLVRNISELAGDDKAEGNELEYLAGSFRNLKQDKQALEGLMHQQQDKLEELFELRLIHGEVQSEEWDEYLEGFGLLAKGCYATVVMILNLREEEVQSMVNEDAICLKILQEMPENLKRKAWMPPIYNTSVIFAILADEDEDALLKKVRDFYDGMQEYTESVCGYRIIMGVSATHTDYHQIREAYRESIHALSISREMAAVMEEGEEKQKMVFREERDCRFYLDANILQGNDYNHHFEEEIAAAVKAVDKKQCEEVTDLFCAYLVQTKLGNEEQMLYILRYVNTILITAVESGVTLSSLYPDGMKKIYRELLEVTEYERIRRYIKWKFVLPVIKKCTDYLESHSSSMIEEIEKLIAESNGNILLTECADKLGVHQTYIWKVLKMERGKSFSEYVEEYKLSEAKRLLLETDLTVAEIAEKLNYTNAQNFIRFFSKNAGITPGKFRKLY